MTDAISLPPALGLYLETLGDPVRLLLLALLCRFGTQSSQVLAERSGLSRQALAKHLFALRRAGLVGDRVLEEERFHGARPEALAALGAWTRQMEAWFENRPDTPADRIEPEMHVPRTRRVVVELRMACPPESVWRALTNPRLIAEWLMGNDFAPVVGRRFTLLADWGDIDCEVLTVEPLQRLAYRWRSMGVDTVVTVTLRPFRWATTLRLEHARIPAGAYWFLRGAQQSWPGYLAGLERVATRV